MEKRVNLHPIQLVDKLELPDATWEVVKTTLADHGVDFIVGSSKRFTYLVEGVVPPSETLRRLKDLDFLILEATLTSYCQEKARNG